MPTASTNHQPAGQSSSSSTAAQSPSSRALSMEKDIRYKQDMAVAQAMKADTSAKRSNNNNTNTKKGQPITQKQVQVALEAIDEAEALHHQAASRRTTRSNDQRYHDALALYQKAIQILLSYLKQPISPKDVIDRSTLQARIQTALTDAEQLKETIQQQKQQQQQQDSSQSTHQQTNTQSLKTSPSASAYIASIFSGSKNAENKPTKKTSTTQAAGRPTIISEPRKSPSSSSSSNTKPKKSSNKQQSSKKLSPTSKKTTKPSPKTSAPEAKSKPSSSSASSQHLLSAKNQEMHHQILDEFYVPTSTLQKTSWDDVAGLEDVKQALQEAVIYPLLRPDLFTGLRRPQNLLLYGPPGTGKTLLVRATASTSNALLFQCSAASLTSKWMGDAEKVVRALFQVAAAAAAQHNTPALLFLDEVDSVLSNRSEGEHEASRRLKTEFMIQMEGLAKNDAANVLCLACTNCPWDLDPAVLRRFPRRLYVPLPDAMARVALLQHVLEAQLENDHSLTKRDVSELAQLLEGYSGSDMMAIASQAAFGPIRECQKQLLQVDKLRPVSRTDWNNALIHAPPPSVSSKLLAQYKQWQNNSQAVK